MGIIWFLEKHNDISDAVDLNCLKKIVHQPRSVFDLVFVQLSQSSTSQVRELQQQNETLRDVVHQMRRQMEALGSQMPSDQSTVTRSAELKPVASDGYNVLSVLFCNVKYLLLYV